MNFRPVLLVLFVLMIGILTPTFVSAIDINSCTSINTSGTYTLTQDIVSTANATCLDIQSNSVIIDCAGYSMTGSNFTGTLEIGIELTAQSDISISNCNIKYFNTGISTPYGSDNTSVYNTSVIGFGGINSGGGIRINTNSILDNVTVISKNIFAPNIIGVRLGIGTNLSNSIISLNNTVNSSWAVNLRGSNNVYNNTITSINKSFIFSSLLTGSIIYNNTINGLYLEESFGGSNYSFNTTVGNTWTNSLGTGFSETCTNDGSGVCVEDLVLLTGTDYEPVALTPVDIYSVNSCRVISVPGTYTINNNLTGNSGTGDCIYISSNDVTIIGYNYTIITSGTIGSDAGLSIANGLDNITVIGGDWRSDPGASNGAGMMLDGSFTNITIKDTIIWGVDSGMYLGNQFGLLINNNTISSSGTPLRIISGDDIVFTNNDVSGGNIISVYFYGSNSVYHSNYFSNMAGLIDISSGDNIEVYNNTLVNSRGFKISSSGTNVSIHNNSILSTTGGGGRIALLLPNGGSLTNEFYNNYVDMGGLQSFLTLDGAVTTAKIIIYNNTIKNTYNPSWASNNGILLNKSTVGNTWTNGVNMFSDTCTNDGSGVCIEDYEIAVGSTDYHPVALTNVCISDWVCNGYDNSSCLINDTSTASCNSVIDLNTTCILNYTGDYTEFPEQTGTCDFCTPSFFCDGLTPGSCDVINETRNYTCYSVGDTNNCFLQTNLPEDNYNGTFTEYDTTISCQVTNTQKAVYGYGVLIFLLPLLIIIGALYGMLGKTMSPNTEKITLSTIGLLVVLIILTLM